MSSREEQRIFKKKIYDYCMSVEWKKEKIDELANSLNMTGLQIRAIARSYARNNFTNDEYQRLDQLINELTKKDRENTKLQKAKQNPILYMEKGKITYYLWENEEEREIVLKYIFDFCKQNYYAENKIVELSDWLGIARTTVLIYAKQYALEYLGYSQEEYSKSKKEYGQKKLQIYHASDNLSKKVYEKLFEVTSLEEIIKVINDSGINIETLRCNVGNYIAVYKNGNNQLKEELKSKIKMYTDYMLQQNNEQRQKDREISIKKENEIKLPIAIDTIRKFLNDKDCDTIDMFCEKYSIDKTTFKDYVTIIKEMDMELFDLYTKKTNNTIKQKYAIIVSQIKYIIKYLKTGIEQFGITRAFDLVDYYMITNISLNDILKIAKPIVSQSEYMLLRKFVNQNISGINHNPGVIKQIMSEKVIISYQKDKKGFPIPGTEEIFSNEEKEKLINFLTENNIPINLKTYNIVYRRYKNGLLDLDTNAKKK